jgi:integrase family protein with SAM-like domain
MAYDWRPSAARSATTDPNVVVPRARAPGAAPPSESDTEGISMAAAIEQFIEAAEQGRAVNRSGREYRPSALRDLSGILRYHVVPELGDLPLREVGRQNVQALVDRLAEEQLSESRIRSVISALRGLYGYAIEQGDADFNPADGLVMPRGARAASSEDATYEEDRGTEVGRGPEEGRRPTLIDRLDDAWADRPRWQDRPRREERSVREERPWREDRPARSEDRPARSEDRPARSEDPWRSDKDSRAARKARKRRDREREREREREAYQPIAVLPERILSFALRAAFVLLIVVAVISLLQPA